MALLKSKVLCISFFLLAHGFLMSASGKHGADEKGEEKKGSARRNKRAANTSTLETIVYDLIPTQKAEDKSTWLLLNNLGSELGVDDKNQISDLSICIWFSLHTCPATSTILSYATSDDKTSVLQIDVQMESLRFSSHHTENHYYEMTYSFAPEHWYHTCVVMDGKNGNNGGTSSYDVTIYFDGQKETEFEIGAPLPADGTLLIGEDHDLLNGVLGTDRSFIGRVSVSIFSEAIQASDVQLMSKCQLAKEPLPANWNSNNRDSSMVAVCEENNGEKFLLVPYKTKGGRKAKKSCAMINTAQALPMSLKDNNILKNILSKAKVCRSSDHNRGWLRRFHNAGTQDIKSNDSLPSYTQNRLQSSKFKTGNLVLMDNGEWDTQLKGKACPLCFGLPTTKFYLYGLCDTNDNSHRLTFHPKVNPDGILMFTSLEGFEIIRDKEWKLVDVTAHVTLASLHKPFFLGVNEWDVLSPMDHCQVPVVTLKINLTITHNSMEEFNCNDGSQIRLEDRCNFQVDCADGSDEVDCDMAGIPDRYNKEDPPPQLPLQIQAYVTVLKTSSVNIKDDTLQVTLAIEMHWRDSRLKFYHLHPDSKDNLINNHLGNIWIPSIQIMNREDITSTGAREELWVERLRDPIISPQGYIYKGSNNDLVYRAEQVCHISCKYYFGDFPWDAQRCPVMVKVDNIPGAAIHLDGNMYASEGSLVMIDYDVLIPSVNTKDDVMSVDMRLKRIPDVHITSSYLPVILIQLLAIGTLFLGVKSFKHRLAMILFLQLMLGAKYASAMSSAPEVSYSTYLDEWYAFSFIFLTFILAAHTVSGILDKEPGKNLQKVHPEEMKVDSVESSTGNCCSDKLRKAGESFKKVDAGSILRVAKRVSILALLIFYLVHWIRVAVSRANSLAP